MMIKACLYAFLFEYIDFSYQSKLDIYKIITMNRETKGKKFSFMDESPPSQKPKQKARGFNFNDFCDEEEQQNKTESLKMNSFINTVDTLGHKTLIPQQIQPAASPLTTESINLTKHPQQQIHKQTKKPDLGTQFQGNTSYLHPQQVAYIENLFHQLLNQWQDSKLIQLISKANFSGNDRYVKQQALNYLLIYNILNNKFAYSVNNSYTKIEISQAPQNKDKYNHLKKWVIYALRKYSDFTIIPEGKNVSKEWLMLAENRINELATKFLNQSKFDEALIVSNIQDQAFLESFQFSTSSKVLKKEYSHLKTKQISITPSISWLVDFAIAIQYFDRDYMAQYLKDICERYISLSKRFKPALVSSLVALVLHFSDEDYDPKLERLLQKIILQEKRLGYIDQVFYLFTLKQYKNKYPKMFKKAVQLLINNIRNPSLLLELLIFSEFNEQSTIASITSFLGKNTYFSTENKQNPEKLYEIIEQKYQDPIASQSLQTSIFFNWMQCEKFLDLLANKRHIEGIQFFSQNYSDIKASKTHSTDELYEVLLKNIVKFELTCSYKSSKRSQYYRILGDLKEKVKHDHKTVIIDGCMAFIELKFKVFWLRDEEKLQSLFELFNYLKALRSDRLCTENAACFITNIRKTLQGLLLSLDGQIYLGEFAFGISDEKEKDELAKTIKKQLKLRNGAFSPSFLKGQYYKLLQMVNWNEKIANFIMIKLMFS